MGEQETYCSPNFQKLCLTRRMYPHECNPNLTYCPYHDIERARAEVSSRTLEVISRAR